MLDEELSHFVIQEAFQQYGRGFWKIDRNNERGGVLH